MTQPEIVTRSASQMASFNQMVTAAVTLIVGILIFNQVQTALPSTSGGINETPIVSTIESAFDLAPVVLIVLIAGLILAQVGGFRRS
jgi:hypothetical protein